LTVQHGGYVTGTGSSVRSVSSLLSSVPSECFAREQQSPFYTGRFALSEEGDGDKKEDGKPTLSPDKKEDGDQFRYHGKSIKMDFTSITLLSVCLIVR
jgi:hypothetical protein